MPQRWTSGTFWPRTGCTLSDNGKNLDCETGQCTLTGKTEGALVCGFGKNGGTPIPPATQIEATTVVGGVGNYDVSLVAGFNVETRVRPVVTGGSCETVGCVADLNKTCPPALQMNVDLADKGPVACGDKFCPEEASCVNGACVVGCLDPCTQCQPPRMPQSLECKTSVASASGYSDCDGGTGRATFIDMYCVKNTSGEGHSQASSNQGTPTCFADVDCPPGRIAGTKQTCQFRGLSPDPPAGSGVCIDINNLDFKWTPLHGPHAGQPQSCKGNQGATCGGYDGDYLDALGYTCQQVQVSSNQTAFPCLPATTSGLGICTKPETDPGKAILYTGVGGLFNEAWLAAGRQAGDTANPYYKIFKTACPLAYAWQYDDEASGFGIPGTACNPNDARVKLSGFDITFCASQFEKEIFAARDSFVQSDQPHDNQGANLVLHVREGTNTLLGFDLLPEGGGELKSARLVLTMSDANSAQRRHRFRSRAASIRIEVLRLQSHFSNEGNGISDVGFGSGVTWECAEDIDINNGVPDCDASWDGGELVANPNATARPLPATRHSGEVAWDVTEDVQQALSDGQRHVQWLLKSRDMRGRRGTEQSFISTEGAMNLVDQGKAPKLMLEFFP
jgi:hypothetical protein